MPEIIDLTMPIENHFRETLLAARERCFTGWVLVYCPQAGVNVGVNCCKIAP